MHYPPMCDIITCGCWINPLGCRNNCLAKNNPKAKMSSYRIWAYGRLRCTNNLLPASSNPKAKMSSHSIWPITEVSLHAANPCDKELPVFLKILVILLSCFRYYKKLHVRVSTSEHGMWEANLCSWVMVTHNCLQNKLSLVPFYMRTTVFHIDTSDKEAGKYHSISGTEYKWHLLGPEIPSWPLAVDTAWWKNDLTNHGLKSTAIIFTCWTISGMWFHWNELDFSLKNIKQLKAQGGLFVVVVVLRVKAIAYIKPLTFEIPMDVSHLPFLLFLIMHELSEQPAIN